MIGGFFNFGGGWGGLHSHAEAAARRWWEVEYGLQKNTPKKNPSKNKNPNVHDKAAGSEMSGFDRRRARVCRGKRERDGERGKKKSQGDICVGRDQHGEKDPVCPRGGAWGMCGFGNCNEF